MAIIVAIWRESIREVELAEEQAQREPELQVRLRREASDA
jgi:hypothetical protein